MSFTILVRWWNALTIRVLEFQNSALFFSAKQMQCKFRSSSGAEMFISQAKAHLCCTSQNIVAGLTAMARLAWFVVSVLQAREKHLPSFFNTIVLLEFKTKVI